MLWSQMTWPAIAAVDREKTLVLLPVASCEQHGHHLPTGTDTILVTAVAELVEARCAESILLLPTLWLGTSEHHLPFGGTLSVPETTWMDLIAQMLAPLAGQGFKRFLVLNGHGGNSDAIRVALRRLHARFPETLWTGASYWELAESELASLVSGKRPTVGHACEIETSMMLALHPELVAMDRTVDGGLDKLDSLRGLFVAGDFSQWTDAGPIGYPSQAEVEKGERMIAAAANRVDEVARALLDRPILVSRREPQAFRD